MQSCLDIDSDVYLQDLLNEITNIIYVNNIQKGLNHKNLKLLNEYTIEGKISRGLIWRVKKVYKEVIEKNINFSENIDLKTEYYALKKTHINTLKKRRYYFTENDFQISYFDKLINEIEIYIKINFHKNIAQLYEIIYNPEQDKFIYFVMELGDLGTIMLRDEDHNYRHNRKLINYLFHRYKEYLSEYKFENDIYVKENISHYELIEKHHLKYDVIRRLGKILFLQIANGLKYLHNLLISHRDIKPDNIVFCSRDNNTKIIDFSASVYFREENYQDIKTLNLNENEVGELKSSCLTDEPGGSIHFQAPEQFEIGKHNPFISDIWSLGVTFYIFICEEFPFDSDSEIELQIKIGENKLEFPSYVDNQMKNLISSMMEKDIKNRIKIDEIINQLENYK